ncbi:hypothetical protein GM708_07775 [Vibrio cholerae]|jgi:hypothetical protein|nr:hypothetical protein [Vibrio cholerae]
MSTPQDNPNGQGNNQAWNPPGGSGQGQTGQQGQPGRGPEGGPYGYQAAQPSGYAYPTPGGDVGVTDKGPAPKEVQRAYYLILAAGVVYLLSAILSTLTTEVPDVEGASIGIVIGLVFSAIIAAVYVLLAIFIRKGANWARITATVLTALNVLFTLVGLVLLPLAAEAAESSGQTVVAPSGLSTALGVVVMLLAVAGVVMTYLKPSRPYFAPKKLGY